MGKLNVYAEHERDKRTIADLLARVAEMERSLAAGRLTVDELQRQFDRAIEQRDELRARVAELEREISVAHVALNRCSGPTDSPSVALTERIECLARWCHDATTRIAALAQEAGRADSLRERIDTLEHEHKRARRGYEERIAKLERERDEARIDAHDENGIKRCLLLQQDKARERIAELERDLAEALERAADAEAERDRLVASHDAAVPRTRALTDRVAELEEALQRTADACDYAADVIRDHLAASYPLALGGAESAVAAARAALSSGNGWANSGKLSEAKKRIAALEEALGDLLLFHERGEDPNVLFWMDAREVLDAGNWVSGEEVPRG